MRTLGKRSDSNNRVYLEKLRNAEHGLHARGYTVWSYEHDLTSIQKSDMP